MVDEANRIAPDRNRKADGSIGDPAHQRRGSASDHNPSDGYVHALDLTHAPASGFDAHARARQVVTRRDRRIKYVISDREIARSYDKPGIPAWTWAPYTGSNPHTFHAHFSVHSDPIIRGDTSPWWPVDDAPPPTESEEDEDQMWEYIQHCYKAAGRARDTKGQRDWFRIFNGVPAGPERKGHMDYMEHALGLNK